MALGEVERARGCTRGLGSVPAEAAGTGARWRPCWFHKAAASWDRAELWVHTSTTPAAARVRTDTAGLSPASAAGTNRT
ncbi:hypothetical protein GCM10010191_59660 [Actinomadura vinacea]|uniref:Uncharacterized protein n=1 Tax=Actinomadura vinacea TaxID=115336 RepID=A0ABN3JQ26_9ACTN